MITSFNITVSGAINGAAVFGPPVPAPAADETGLIAFTVVNAGILDPATIAPYVGNGGWILCGCSITAAGGTAVRVGIINPDAAFSTQQEIYPAAQLAPAQYRYRPVYVPAGWRLRFLTAGEVAGGIRLDVMPLTGVRNASRGIAATRLHELVPAVA